VIGEGLLEGMDPGLGPLSRIVLQVVWDLFRERGRWPTFGVVDVRLDRRHEIDARTALPAVPASYMLRSLSNPVPRDDELVQLSLRGIAACEGGTHDLELLARLLNWLARTEREHDPDETGQPLVVTSDQAAAQLALDPGRKDDQAALGRLRFLLERVPSIYSQASYRDEEPWWQFTIQRDIRQFRGLDGADELLRRLDAHDPERTVERSGVPQTIAATLTLLERFRATLRPEILEACGVQLEAELYDDAVFAAFRLIEHAVQDRTRIAAIGDTLVKQAFRDARTRIQISTRPQDAERLIEVFGGALGLLKGDRSHKATPAVPCRTLESCLRLLAWASALLDLLDRDLAIAPDVRGSRYLGDTMELWVDRAGAQPQIWLAGEWRRLLRRASDTMLVIDTTTVAPGDHELYVVDGLRQSRSLPVHVPRPYGVGSWYRVIEIAIPLLADAQGQHSRDVSGMRLLAYEGGVVTERIVPVLVLQP
jgi:Protein of unknown function (Hypoth_ymh)